MTRLDKLTQNEKSLQSELAKLQADHKKAFADLAALPHPSEAGAQAVAALEVKIKILQEKVLAAQETIKAEADRLKSPEAKAAIKEVARLESELDAGRSEIAKLLMAVFDKAAALQKVNERWIGLRATSGEELDGLSTGFDARSVWIRGMANTLAVLKERGAMAEK